MESAPPPPKVKVLMVDDDTNLLESFRRTLRGHYDLYTANGGEAALSTLETKGPFAVVISDIKMPSMSGVELLSRVKKAYPDSVRMVLTGFADLQIAISAVNRGDIFRFLTKPCDNEAIIQAINAAIEQHELSNAAKELAVVQRIKGGLEGTLRAFTRLVEFRDPYTAGHMDRTAEISGMIAERLEIDADTSQGLRLAALVHDIGKIAVPAGILNKPGKLSEAEFALIKAHPMVGADVFQAMDTEWPLSRIILEHHERIDGSGYPNGLLGSQLLIESKILQVADVMDATMSHRPYRQNLGPKASIQILKDSRGTILDPQAVDVGISLLQEHLPIWDDLL